MKKITDYLDKREEQLVFIQGKIPRSLYDELKTELNRLDISWSKYLIAVSRRFVEEVKHEASNKRHNDKKHK